MMDTRWQTRLTESSGSLRARCTNVIHDLGSTEPRSKVKPSSR